LASRLLELATAASEYQLRLSHLRFRAVYVRGRGQSGFAAAARGIQRGLYVLQGLLVDADQRLDADQLVVRLLDLKDDVLQYAAVREVRGQQSELRRLCLVIPRAKIVQNIAEAYRRAIAIDPWRNQSVGSRHGMSTVVAHRAGNGRQVVAL
jgi:hypothetical protein